MTPVTNAGVLGGEALIEESRNRAASRLGGRDRLASLLLGSLFVATAAALALLAGTDRTASAWTIVVLVAAYAVASSIDFEVGTGYAVPTQLVLIPMLALLPSGSCRSASSPGSCSAACTTTRADAYRSIAAFCASSIRGTPSASPSC